MAFRSRRQKRYEKMRSYGLLPFEAKELSSVPFAHAPFLNDILRDRRRIILSLRKEAEFQGWSRAKYEKELRMVIAVEYMDKGLVFRKAGRGIIKIQGSPDPWQLFREYRDQSIRKGKWVETPRRRRHKRKYDERGIRIDKGNIQAQKQRYRERQKRLKQS